MEKKKAIVLVICVLGIALMLWPTGVTKLLIYGIRSITGDAKNYTTAQGHGIQGQYSVSIDLADFKSNIGKELYHDGKYKIDVSWIDHTGGADTGGYRIGFRSYGTYSLGNAVLISGVHYSNNSDGSFTSQMAAKMTAEYHGKIYTSPVYSPGALIHRDGDEFAFYIFPGDAYENGRISLNEKGIVRLTITNLYQNVWKKR